MALTPEASEHANLGDWRRICQAILANTPDLAFVFDLQHRVVYANPALLTAWGKTWAEAEGRTLVELGLAPQQAALRDREMDRVVTSKQPVRGEVAFTGADGLGTIFEYIFVPVPAANGRVAAVAGTSRDITARSHAEAELRRLAEIVEHSGDMIETAELNGAVTYINPAGLRMLGWKEIPPQATLRDFFPPECADRYLAEVRRRQFISEGWEGEVEFQNRSTGERIPVHAKAFAIRDQNRRPMARGFVARDMRELRRAEAALVQADKLATMGRLAATVAHEINNPLAAAVNCIYLLGRERNLPPRAHQILQQAEVALERVSAVTRHTLSYFRAEPQVAPVDLAEMLRGVAGSFLPRAAQSNVRVQTRLASGVRVDGHANELRQAVTNLVANALDAMAETGGTLLIRLRARPAAGSGSDHSGACITVADTGPGIAPARLNAIFEPFETGKRGGIGLGLWISRGIVAKHGGSLQARNRRHGGAAFQILLPAHPPRQ